jgi:hypothetical protein
VSVFSRVCPTLLTFSLSRVKDGFPSTSRLTSDLGIGGCSISVHEPVAAVAWIENNWDHSLLSSFQNNNCDGPLPMMLFPTRPALALFGSYHDPFVTDAAQSLAKLSGFPVVIRPSSDNPIRTLLCGFSRLPVRNHIDFLFLRIQSFRLFKEYITSSQ